MNSGGQNMRVLENVQPQKVFYYFEELAGIPHGSYHTKGISDYCMNFAKERELEAYQDAYNNVVIIKEATAGYESAEPIILQGHLDMVCEKENDTEIDFENEGLRLFIDGDFVKAKGTTLGGDDGIAIAYALAILDSDEIAHPRLECVFTVDEEVGMLGAEKIDLSMLKGHQVLNIDSDVEGTFLTSCAGGVTAECSFPLVFDEAEGLQYRLTLTGLMGGHSGGEIDKERANAIVEIGRILKHLDDTLEMGICALNGGLKDNAIPRECICDILVTPEDEKKLEDAVFALNHILKKEYQASDPDIVLRFEKLGTKKTQVLGYRSQSRILFFLRNMPNGIQHMSMEIPGLPETSLNAGIMKMTEEEFSVSFSVRSSVKSRKEEVMDRLSYLSEFLGGTVTFTGNYPAWEYKKDSKVRELVLDVYRDLYQKEPKIEAIHAGLECGILSEKIENLDCVSFGPDNFDIHTPKERLSISSTERVWKFILEFLKRAK